MMLSGTWETAHLAAQRTHERRCGRKPGLTETELFLGYHVPD